jgi:hypothetical protein
MSSSFWGISFAWKFQLICILLFAVLSFIAAKKINRNQNISLILFIQIIMLLLFPVWLNIYISGVISNSDGAELTQYYEFGWLIYAVICLFETALLIVLLKMKSK